MQHGSRIVLNGVEHKWDHRGFYEAIVRTQMGHLDLHIVIPVPHRDEREWRYSCSRFNEGLSTAHYNFLVEELLESFQREQLDGILYARMVEKGRPRVITAPPSAYAPPSKKERSRAHLSVVGGVDNPEATNVPPPNLVVVQNDPSV